MTNVTTRISMGLFEEDGEKFYVVFDPVHGDMEFGSVEAFSSYITSDVMTWFHGSFEWVTDNEPVELHGFEWLEPEGEDVFPRGVVDIRISVEILGDAWLKTSGTVPNWSNNNIITTSFI